MRRCSIRSYTGTRVPVELPGRGVAAQAMVGGAVVRPAVTPEPVMPERWLVLRPRQRGKSPRLVGEGLRLTVMAPGFWAGEVAA